MKVKCSLPNHENECQQSVNDCWPSITVNYSAVGIIVFIHGFDCLGTPKGLRILNGSSVNEMSSYHPRGSGRNIPYISAHTGCHLLLYGCM